MARRARTRVGNVLNHDGTASDVPGAFDGRGRAPDETLHQRRCEGLKTGSADLYLVVHGFILSISAGTRELPGAQRLCFISRPENYSLSEKFSIRRQNCVAIRKSNISLPRLLGSDWRCAQILIA